MGICGSKTTTDPPASGNTTGGTAGSGNGTGSGANANPNASGKGGESLSLGSLGPVPIGGRDQSFPSVIGPPSLRKAPSHQAVISMTNLLNGKCRFAGTVTEEDNKDVPIAGADGDYRAPPALAGADGKALASLQLTVKGRQKWRVTVQLGVSANPKPADADGEESIPVTAELCADGADAQSAEYRMSAMDVDVHSMGSLRLIEEVHLRLLHVNDPARAIVCSGSLSWRLHDEPKPAAAAAAVVAAPAPAPTPTTAAPVADAAAAPAAVPVVAAA